MQKMRESPKAARAYVPPWSTPAKINWIRIVGVSIRIP
jgi:hypothetical protein